ncbi:Metalloenzyme, LuxS/M16 peptidase-like protein [Kockovaella imperatae]|uniref:Cytochrome b-c1 complex subunit 2, mitochondrial n=1 Tax=Kockovaella imperatae TaxID=4999 RepID=A0A1Y1UCH1_9TREE|nr:Metalloenzyme, LuxS/M16 peptidase-like protein [Kockovaella imperatae]ORX35748.1 Metalloenzyme, LuxS/M16 peptidase-like protein [Kockovaella imperatae]
MSRFLRPSALPQTKRLYSTVQLSPPGVSNFTLAVRAGPRYEPKAGVAHALKNFAYKSNDFGSALRIARESELFGAQLTASLTREHLLLSASCLKGDEQRFLDILTNVLSTTNFHPHEFAELVVPTMAAESAAAAASSTVTAVEALHHTAFRRGLGNSLYASPLNPVSAADVEQFARTAFAMSNIQFISNDVSSGPFSRKFGRLPFNKHRSEYHGGETRIAMPHGVAPTIAVGFGQDWPADSTLQVLAEVLGGTPSVKWGSKPGILGEIDATIETRLNSYSDAALISIVMTAPTDKALAVAAHQLRGLLEEGFEFHDEVVEAAKEKVRFTEWAKMETVQGQIDFALAQEIADDIENVTTEDCIEAMDSILDGLPTYVAAGDLSVLPYADEIGLGGGSSA